jgi:localization factor PodJL
LPRSRANYALATKWYAEAASYGLADSQFNLGVLAEQGLGQPRDLVQAYQWFAIVAATGDAKAAKRRDQVKSEMTVAEFTKAEQAVRAWPVKPQVAEANVVAEQPSWRAANETQSKALVARAQTLLAKLGYDAGTADGEAGPRTREAIKAFERRGGLEETGEVTLPLVAKLERQAS